MNGSKAAVLVYLFGASDSALRPGPQGALCFLPPHVCHHWKQRSASAPRRYLSSRSCTRGFAPGAVLHSLPSRASLRGSPPLAAPLASPRARCCTLYPLEQHRSEGQCPYSDLSPGHPGKILPFVGARALCRDALRQEQSLRTSAPGQGPVCNGRRGGRGGGATLSFVATRVTFALPHYPGEVPPAGVFDPPGDRVGA
jgi:hypothetical protein